jgi:ABC-type glycerol-3-phosphate transport system permease component
MALITRKMIAGWFSSRKRRPIDASLNFTYIVLVIFCFIIVVPFAWVLSSSLKDDAQYFVVPTQWIPNPPIWSNYPTVIIQYRFLHYIFNSLWLALYSVVTNVFVSSLVAYGFARFRFPGRNFLFLIVLATLMLPGQVLTISLYKVFRDLGWINTFLPILVPKLFGSAFDIFLFRQFFLGLPREIDEAARIDGCNAWRIYWNITMPQSKPVIIVIGIFTFLWSWRDLWGPLIYLNSEETRTLPMALLTFNVPGKGTDYPLLLAATTIALVVPLFIYLLGQRYIDNGIVVADLK